MERTDPVPAVPLYRVTPKVAGPGATRIVALQFGVHATVVDEPLYVTTADCVDPDTYSGDRCADAVRAAGMTIVRTTGIDAAAAGANGIDPGAAELEPPPPQPASSRPERRRAAAVRRCGAVMSNPA